MDLGEPLAEVPRGWGLRILLWILFLGFAAGGVALIASGAPPWSWILMAVLAILCQMRIRSEGRKRLHIHANGVRLEPAGRQILWKDVSQLVYSASQTYVNGIPTPTQYRLMIRPLEGKALVIDNGFKRPREPIDMVMKLTHPHLVERAIELFNRTGEVPFGPLTFTKMGLRSKGLFGSKDIPFEAIEHMGVESGQFVIKTKGKWLSAASVPVASIPNFTVLSALLEYAYSPPQEPPPLS